MTALQSLNEKMERTHLYNLGDTRVEAEIEAYAAALQPVYDAFEEIQQESFIESAEDNGLDFWCRICGISRETYTDSMCRKMILQRLSVGSDSYTYDSVLSHIQSYGYGGSFTFSAGNGTILFCCTTQNLTNAQKLKLHSLLKKIFPPTITLAIEYGV